MRHPRTSKPVSFVHGILPTAYLYSNDLLSESTTDVVCGYELRNNGQLWVTDTSGTYYRPGAAQDWLRTGISSQFEVMATDLTGDVGALGGVYNSWLGFGSNVLCTITALDTTIKSAGFLVLMRLVGEQTPRWQCRMTLTADATL